MRQPERSRIRMLVIDRSLSLVVLEQHQRKRKANAWRRYVPLHQQSRQRPHMAQAKLAHDDLIARLLARETFLLHEARDLIVPRLTAANPVDEPAAASVTFSISFAHVHPPHANPPRLLQWAQLVAFSCRAHCIAAIDAIIRTAIPSRRGRNRGTAEQGN